MLQKYLGQSKRPRESPSHNKIINKFKGFLMVLGHKPQKEESGTPPGAAIFNMTVVLAPPAM
ncbi:MAG: hypothetical protein VX050_05460 [Planctomycetota bacterium]|nr:hypothetical protein [Planctomycetota bacterium]